MKLPRHCFTIKFFTLSHKLVAFTSAATLDPPVVVRAEITAAATRDDKFVG